MKMVVENIYAFNFIAESDGKQVGCVVMTAQDSQELIEYIQRAPDPHVRPSAHKVNGIKRLHDWTKCSLLEAKYIYERHEQWIRAMKVTA